MTARTILWDGGAVRVRQTFLAFAKVALETRFALCTRGAAFKAATTSCAAVTEAAVEVGQALLAEARDRVTMVQWKRLGAIRLLAASRQAGLGHRVASGLLGISCPTVVVKQAFDASMGFRVADLGTGHGEAVAAAEAIRIDLASLHALMVFGALLSRRALQVVEAQSAHPRLGVASHASCKTHTDGR